MPTKPDIPAVVTLEPWRVYAVYGLILVASAILYGLASLLGLWKPLFAQVQPPLGPLIAITLSVLLTRILIRFYGAILQNAFGLSLHRLVKAIQSDDLENARAAYEAQAQVFEARPWLDRWRTVLFLDAGAYPYADIARLNAAHLSYRMGDIDRALALYAQVESRDPHNTLASQSLNLARAVRGEPIKSIQPPIPLGRLVDRGLQRRMRFVWLALIPILALPCGIAYFLVSTVVTGSIWLAFILAMVVAAGILLMRLVRLVVHRVLLFDLVRGLRLYRKGRFSEAVASYEKQLQFLRENPRADEWRAVLFLNPSTYGYRELVMIYIANAVIQLGDAAKVESLMNDILALNPTNGYALNTLGFIRLARGDA
jgi:tetratricopeptide (TPR) repeat protein